MSEFATSFAKEFKGFMRANNVTGAQLADTLGRNAGYVSERVNGKRALDTNDVDALASLVNGWTGVQLMRELARRTREASHVAPVTPIRATIDLPEAAAESIPFHPEDTDDKY